MFGSSFVGVNAFQHYLLGLQSIGFGSGFGGSGATFLAFGAILVKRLVIDTLTWAPFKCGT